MTLLSPKWNVAYSGFLRGRLTVDRLALVVAASMSLALTFVWYSIATSPLAPSSGAQTEKAVQQTVALGKLRPTKRYALQEFSEINARPIFTPSRRAPPKKVKLVAPLTAKPAPPPPLIGYWTLVGVAIWPDAKVALLHSATGVTETAIEGQSVGGWRVFKIAPDRVVFHYHKSEKTLELAEPAVPSAGSPNSPIISGRTMTTPRPALQAEPVR